MVKLGQAKPRLLCSLVHKFVRKNVDDFDAFIKELESQPSKTVGDVFVFVDECHHTQVKRFFVQRMKTKWGSCSPTRASIRLNTDLAKKPRECLEYIVVHEMVHLLEPTHNATFVALMDRFMPQWRFYREKLNRLPVRHEEWAY
jgi:predicted metal-dependent hydrolase